MTWSLTCIIPLLAIGQAGGPTVDADQFARLIEGCWADIRDFDLVTEGTFRYVDRTDPDPEKSRRNDLNFQSNYAFRWADAAGYFEVYNTYEDPTRDPWTSVFAQLGEELNQTGRFGTTDPSRMRARRKPVDRPGEMTLVGTPERFIFHWYWKHAFPNMTHGVSGYQYQFEGWEDVDGHRCLRVSFKGVWGPDVIERFWIDLDRGGHALKREFTDDGNLWMRTHSVRLDRLATHDGNEVWFPVGGVLDSFVKDAGPKPPRYLDTPVFRETYHVVRSSVAINRDPPDDRFTVGWASKRAGSPELQQARTEFAAIPPKPETRVPTDPASVAEWQRENLAAADRLARMLDASAPSSRSWNGATATQVGLVALGATLIVAALLRRRAG